MADERQPSSGREGDDSRDGRRRYFRRRQRPGQSGREGGAAREGSGPRASNNPRDGGPRQAEQRNFRKRGSERRAPENAETRNARVSRRRRHTRAQENLTANPRADPLVPEVVDLADYRVPSSVFVYTHVSRSGSGWDTYEFRAEHFSKGGRTLDDFDIDLSKLYPDSADKAAANSDEGD